MEKKRKLPARAAARVEQQAAKRRHISPQQKSKSSTPTPAPEPELLSAEEALPSLPTSIAAGKPLPTVDSPQPSDLSNSEYQSVTESGVLSESLARSRNQWITDSIFQKYWSKPVKKRGVVIEEPNNPPKDSMMKLGQVTIVVEPHHFEATMYAVKDPKPPPPPPVTKRPVLQYGPPNGVLPPPATPTPAQAKEKPPLSSTPQPNGIPSQSEVKPPSQPQLRTQSVPEAQKQTQAQPQTQPQTQHQQAQTQTQPKIQHQQARTPPQSQSQAPIHSSTSSTSQNLSAPTVPAQSVNVPPTPPAPPAPPTPLPAPSMSAPATSTPTTATPIPGVPAVSTPALSTPTLPPNVQRPVASPRGMESILSPNSVTPQPPRPPATAPFGIQPPRPSPLPTGGILRPPLPPGVTAPAPPPIHTGINPTAPKPPVNGPPVPAATAPGKPSTDPIILLLAERANTDPTLRDLMRLVAQGEANREELRRFQAFIDRLTEESKLKSQPGPTADELVVDGRTVKYFASEVRTILDIVLTSRPKQTSADLRPPAGVDPLIIALVKAALDDIKTREIVRRISENKTQPLDPRELKTTLERLLDKIKKEKEAQETKSPATPVTAKTNGTVNGAASSSSALGTPTTSQPQQALRSKGPPPPPKLDISAIVFEFAGGTGDRYLFPKFSILENITMLPGSGQQIIASFMIVRRGSQSEYPQADPEHDYYQPVTIRLFAHTGRHLEHLPQVVAPKEEVRTYMDNIIDTMTRGEYVLLAMRLPRRDGTEVEDTEMGGTDTTKEQETELVNKEKENVEPTAPGGVLWATKPPKVEMAQARRSSLARSVLTAPKERLREMEEDAQYQSFIAKVTGNSQQAE